MLGGSGAYRQSPPAFLSSGEYLETDRSTARPCRSPWAGALIAGLAIGIALPELSFAMRPWLPEIVAVLLFVSACGVGPRQAMGAVTEQKMALFFVAILQVLLAAVPGGFLSHFRHRRCTAACAHFDDFSITDIGCAQFVCSGRT